MRTTRHAEIRRLHLAQGSATVSDIHTAIGASEATVRRDLDQLEAEDVVERVHGGARLTVESAFGKREGERLAAKRAIGLEASLLVSLNSTNIPDSGTAELQLARAVRPSGTACAVHTNGLTIAQALVAAQAISLWMLGGRLRRENLSMVGPSAEGMLEGLWFDNLFMGAGSVASDGMIYGVDQAEAKLNGKMATRASHVLADASKFGRASTYAIGALGDGMTVISDASLSV